MSTVTTDPAIVTETGRGRKWLSVAAVRNKIAGVFATLAALLYVVAAAPANAATPNTDLLNGAQDSFFGSISGFLTDNLLPLVFVLAAVVIGATMLIRYGRKAVSS